MMCSVVTVCPVILDFFDSTERNLSFSLQAATAEALSTWNARDEEVFLCDSPKYFQEFSAV